MKADEMVILKAVSFKLDDETMCIATYQYHVEHDEATGKVMRAKSRYRWLARVMKIADVREQVAWHHDDCRRLEKWKWPDDPSWDGCIALNDSSNEKASAWLACRLKKLVDWEQGQKLLRGWKAREQEYSRSSAYELDDYQTEDGEMISLTDREALKKQVGKNLWKEMLRNVKARAREKVIEDLRSKTGPGPDVIWKADYDKLSWEEKQKYIVKPKKLMKKDSAEVASSTSNVMAT